MSPNNHWRAGPGYHYVEDSPGAPPEVPPGWFIPQPPPPGVFVPPQVAHFPLGPPNLDMAAPPGFVIPERGGGAAPQQGWGFWGWVNGAPAAAAPNWDPVPGLHLEGGFPEGHGYLFTGNPCSVHVFRGTPSQFLSSGQDIWFEAHKVSSNSSVNDLLKALGGVAGSSITQMYERGNGEWRQGTTFVQGSREANDTLGFVGWAFAGDNVRPPVWLAFAK